MRVAKGIEYLICSLVEDSAIICTHGSSCNPSTLWSSEERDNICNINRLGKWCGACILLLQLRRDRHESIGFNRSWVDTVDTNAFVAQLNSKHARDGLHRSLSCTIN